MSWRFTQLGYNTCIQDDLIIKLFNNKTVKYVGRDLEFAKHLKVDDKSNNLVLIINRKIWISEIGTKISQNFKNIECFYIGINRYLIQGNDTHNKFFSSESPGESTINILKFYLDQLGYSVEQQGWFDNDDGKYFNFVQPVTWVYGRKKTNISV